MKTEKERQDFIKNEDNWVVISQTDNVRTLEIRYKGVSAFRQEKLRDGKWRKDFWYRFNPAYKPVKMDIRDFVTYLETIDKQRPDR